MYLIDSLHQRGIGVILDWVPSHFPNDEHGLAYFDGTHLFEHADPRQGFHPEWKSAIFNYGRAEVRDFLGSSALFWLKKFHADALRVDGVASMLYLDYARSDGELSLIHIFEAHVFRPYVGDALARAQRLELREGKILGEPPLGCNAIDNLGFAPGGKCKVVGDVRGRPDFVFVARDEHPVLRHDEIGLDEVGALLDRDEIRRQRVLRNIAARPAVTDHDRCRCGGFA